MTRRAIFSVILWFFALPAFGLPAHATPPSDWTLVRSVANPAGGTIDFVLVPARKQRDTGYYRKVAARVCGERDTAMVFFWTDRTHVPESAWMPVNDLRVMTAQYERHPNYKEPSLRLAHWLYPTEEAGRRAHCFHAP